MSAQVEIPGYVAGTWGIDPAHSEVGFQARHLGIAKVRGNFDDYEGTIVTAENPLDSTVNVVVKTASVSTRQDFRDGNLKGNDFLHVEEYPEMVFSSTGIRPDGDGFLLDGDLTIRGVTKQVTMDLEVNGFSQGFDGKPVAGFSASTEINRHDFGVVGGPASAMVSDKVKIVLEIEVAKRD
jgi:polyisoprenoid-binding protein YceI